MFLGADEQGGQPGGCEGQGGEGHVLRREDEDGKLCRRAQNRSHLVQVRLTFIRTDMNGLGNLTSLTPMWNLLFLTFLT